MKFSAQEEYGLRCLLRIGKFFESNRSVTIPEIASWEGISQHNAAKLLRLLRLGGFLESERGQSGGYQLARDPSKIRVKDVLSTLGGRLYDDSFCNNHSGVSPICTNSIDCSVRSLWKIIQDAVDGVIENISLKDMLESESEVSDKLNVSLEKFLTNNF